MTVCMYRDIHTTTLYYWPHTTGMPHLKVCYLCSEGNVHGDRVTNVGLIS